MALRMSFMIAVLRSAAAPRTMKMSTNHRMKNPPKVN